MKKITWYLTLVSLMLLIIYSCSKEKPDQHTKQQNTAIARNVPAIFSSGNFGYLHKMIEIAKKLDFAVTPTSSTFISNSGNLDFTNQTSNTVLNGTGGCLVSTLGAHEGEYGYGMVFNYGSADRLANIKVYADGFERVVFSYNSSGLVKNISYYYLEDGVETLDGYDNYYYNSSGQVIEIYEHDSFIDASLQCQYDGQGHLIRMYTDYYNSEYLFNYQNDNIVQFTVRVSVYGDIYTETYEYQYDNHNNYWLPLNVPAIFGGFAWAISKNNITREVYTDMYGDTETTNCNYDYNAEGYPVFAYSDKMGNTFWAGYGPIEYTNCSK